MAGEPIVTLVGNATRDAEIKFFDSGTSVCRFTLAVTPRTKKGDNWEDGEPTYYRCHVWRDPAENAVQTISKGMRLLVQGRLSTRTYKDNDGIDRTSIEIDVDEIGPTLRYATATVKKVSRTSAARSGGGATNPGTADDPWTGTPPGAAPNDDEPPF